jgi:hypothetical protein
VTHGNANSIRGLAASCCADEAERERPARSRAESAGETLGYWSLEHGVSKNELIAAIVRTWIAASRTIWDNLRRLHPKLQMMQERVKKMRTHRGTGGARQILGLSPGVPTMGACQHAHRRRR